MNTAGDATTATARMRPHPARLAQPARAAVAVDVIASSDVVGRRICDVLERAGFLPSLTEPAALSGRDGLVVVAGQGRVADSVGALTQAHPGLQVIAVVDADDEHQLRPLLAGGAAAIVSTAEVAEALVPTIHALRAGQAAVPSSMLRAFVRPALTGREKQALALVVLGLSNVEIASTLHLTVSTVKSHLRSAFRKLGAKTRSEATAIILDPVAGHGLGILSITDGQVPA